MAKIDIQMLIDTESYLIEIADLVMLEFRHMLVRDKKEEEDIEITALVMNHTHMTKGYTIPMVQGEEFREAIGTLLAQGTNIMVTKGPCKVALTFVWDTSTNRIVNRFVKCTVLAGNDFEEILDSLSFSSGDKTASEKAMLDAILKAKTGL